VSFVQDEAAAERWLRMCMELANDHAHNMMQQAALVRARCCWEML
jgi:hypothetical protein